MPYKPVRIAQLAEEMPTDVAQELRRLGFYNAQRLLIEPALCPDMGNRQAL